MRMLENEIGLDAVIAGMQDMVKNSKGREFTWSKLRPYFEASSKTKLDWFWRQWVETGDFPTLNIFGVKQRDVNRRWETRVYVRQDGTPNPFKLKFKLRLTGKDGKVHEELVTMRAPQETFQVMTDWQPNQTEIIPFEYSLVKGTFSKAVPR